jgi:hypothetical protein
MISCHRCRPPPIYFLSVIPIALHQKREKEETDRERAIECSFVVAFYDMKRKEKERENSIYVDKRGFDEI